MAVLEKAHPRATPTPEQHPIRTGRHILIVEDDPRAAAVIRDTLQLEGEPSWTIMVANDGERALEYANEMPPHLVLLDMHLPRIGGADVYRRLRANARTSAARILFLTGATSHDLHQQGVEDGAILRKPFDVRQLVSIVRSLLAE